MHFWSFGKYKRKYITNKDIDMKFGPDLNSATNSLARNFNPAKFELKIILTLVNVLLNNEN